MDFFDCFSFKKKTKKTKKTKQQSNLKFQIYPFHTIARNVCIETIIKELIAEWNFVQIIKRKKIIFTTWHLLPSYVHLLLSPSMSTWTKLLFKPPS